MDYLRKTEIVYLAIKTCVQIQTRIVSGWRVFLPAKREV